MVNFLSARIVPCRETKTRHLKNLMAGIHHSSGNAKIIPQFKKFGNCQRVFLVGVLGVIDRIRGQLPQEHPQKTPLAEQSQKL
jgi:hypothetical protein